MGCIGIPLYNTTVWREKILAKQFTLKIAFDIIFWQVSKLAKAPEIIIMCQRLQVNCNNIQYSRNVRLKYNVLLHTNKYLVQLHTLKVDRLHN